MYYTCVFSINSEDACCATSFDPPQKLFQDHWCLAFYHRFRSAGNTKSCHWQRRCEDIGQEVAPAFWYLRLHFYGVAALDLHWPFVFWFYVSFFNIYNKYRYKWYKYIFQYTHTHTHIYIYINVRVCVYNSFAITPKKSRRSVSCGPLQVEMEYQKWEICQVHSKSPFLGVFNCCLHSCRVWSACRVFFFTYWHAQSPWLTKLQANEHMASWDSDLFFQPWRLAKKSGLFVGHCLGAGKQIGGSCAKWIFLRCRPCQDSGRSSCLVILAYLLWAPRLPL